MVRHKKLKREVNDNSIIQGVRALQNVGIHIATENILGIPDTNLEQDFKTLELNQILRPSFANPSLYQPYPQTPLGDLACEVGAFSGDYDDIPDFYEGSCLKIDHLRELQNLKYLFSIAVEYPWIMRYIPKLIKLPLSSVYKKMELFWKGYALTRRIVPIRMGIRHSLHVFRRAISAKGSIIY